MFEEEKPFLQPLPTTCFEYYRVLERTVHFDAHIEVDGAYYSAPPRYAGQKLPVNVGRLWLRILDPSTSSAFASIRPRSTKGSATHQRRRPPKANTNESAERAIASPAPALAAAPLRNSSGGTRCDCVTSALRHARFARRYEAAAVDNACAFAAASGIGSFSFCGPISRTTPNR